MEGVSGAAIEVLIQNLINVFKEERSLIRGLDGDAEQLQTTLVLIQSYLSDAEKKSITQAAVTAWLKKLEALAFDADNVLDELNYHLLRKKIIKHKLSNYSSYEGVLYCKPHFGQLLKMTGSLNKSFEATGAPRTARIDRSIEQASTNSKFSSCS